MGLHGERAPHLRSKQTHACFTAYFCTMKDLAADGCELSLCVRGLWQLCASLPPCPLRSSQIGSAAAPPPPRSLPRLYKGKVLANTVVQISWRTASPPALLSAPYLPRPPESLGSSLSALGALRSNPALLPQSPRVLDLRTQLYLGWDLSAPALGFRVSWSTRGQRSRGPPGTSRGAGGAARGAGHVASESRPAGWRRERHLLR